MQKAVEPHSKSEAQNLRDMKVKGKIKKESYHVPNALAEASPSAYVRNVHDLDSSVDRVTKAVENVNLNRGDRESEQELLICRLNCL